MNYIVLDLEFNNPFEIDNITKRFKKVKPNLIMPQEIIEIGAVKLDNKFKFIDSFQIFIKPQLYKKLHPNVKRKTKISNKDLYDALYINECIDSFIKWIGKDYILCTWSSGDIFTLENNCVFYNINTNWIDKYIDIQYIYSIQNKIDKQESLKNAVKFYKIEINNKMHRALNDAIYESEIIKYLDKDIINQNIMRLKDFKCQFKNDVVYGLKCALELLRWEDNNKYE